MLLESSRSTYLYLNQCLGFLSLYEHFLKVVAPFTFPLLFYMKVAVLNCGHIIIDDVSEEGMLC